MTSSFLLGSTIGAPASFTEVSISNSIVFYSRWKGKTSFVAQSLLSLKRSLELHSTNQVYRTFCVSSLAVHPYICRVQLSINQYQQVSNERYFCFSFFLSFFFNKHPYFRCEKKEVVGNITANCTLKALERAGGTAP